MARAWPPAGRPSPIQPPSRWPPPSSANTSIAWLGGNMSASAQANRVGTSSSTDLVAEVEFDGHRLADLAEQLGEVLRPGSDARVQLVHRRSLQRLSGFRADLGLLAEHRRIDRVAPDVRRNHDESIDKLWVLDGRPEGDATTERVAEQIGLLETEMRDQRGDIAAIRSAGEAARCPPSGHDPGGRPRSPHAQPRASKHRTEHLAQPEPAVKQDQGSPRAVGLVVEVDPVDVGVSDPSRSRGCSRRS